MVVSANREYLQHDHIQRLVEEADIATSDSANERAEMIRSLKRQGFYAKFGDLYCASVHAIRTLAPIAPETITNPSDRLFYAAAIRPESVAEYLDRVFDIHVCAHQLLTSVFQPEESLHTDRRHKVNDSANKLARAQYRFCEVEEDEIRSYVSAKCQGPVKWRGVSTTCWPQLNIEVCSKLFHVASNYYRRINSGQCTVLSAPNYQLDEEQVQELQRLYRESSVVEVGMVGSETVKRLGQQFGELLVGLRKERAALTGEMFADYSKCEFAKVTPRPEKVQTASNKVEGSGAHRIPELSRNAAKGVEILCLHLREFHHPAIHAQKFHDRLASAGFDSIEVVDELTAAEVVRALYDSYQCATVYHFDAAQIQAIRDSNKWPVCVGESSRGETASSSADTATMSDSLQEGAISRIWIASLKSLRSRFEVAANSHRGIRCSLVRESFDAGDCPISKAMLDDENGRRDVIGHAADGVNGVVGGFLAGGSVSYTVWFVHESLRIAAKDTSEMYTASRQASSCEDRYWELAEEAGRLLRDLPTHSCPLLVDLLSTVNLIYGRLLWFVAVFEAARRRPPGTVLRTSVSIPRILAAPKDIAAVTDAACIPDSLIVNLDCNPFVGSIALIDCILDAVEEQVRESPQQYPSSTDYPPSKGLGDAASGIERQPAQRVDESAYPTGKTTPVLSQLKYDILQAMLELCAVSADTRRTAEEIAAKVEGKGANANKFKLPLVELGRDGLLGTKKGRGGGSWLTDSGRAAAEVL